MNVFGKDAEKALIEFIDHLREDPAKWRALHFHFSALQGETRQGAQLQSIPNIIQAEMGNCFGAAYLCRDGDLILIFEQTASAHAETVVTDLRFLFSDDPLASAAYVSGQQDGFCTPHDLGLAFDPFFYLCLHKLALAKQAQEGEKPLEEVAPSLPSSSFFQKVAQDRLDRKFLRMLVAEDSYFSRQMIRQALLLKGEVLLAKDGWECISHYLNYAPNIIFLDIDMPHMNGHQVLLKIKEYDPKPFVVMLTASNLSNDIKNAVAHGAKGYIVKPFTVSKLTAYVDQYSKETGRLPQQR